MTSGRQVKVNDIKINQKTLIPLFNVELEDPVHFNIAEDQCVERLTFNLFPEPVRIIPGKPIINKTDNKPRQILVKPPNIGIHFYAWKGKEKMASEVSNVLPVDQLPADFDSFDNIGFFAVRPGSGGLGGFQTVTNLHTRRNAKTLLIIEFDQLYPQNIASYMTWSTNPYGINLVDSLLDAVRLISGDEPHQYKAYHFNDNKILETLTKWPLSEMQGNPVKLNTYDLDELKKLFLQVWQIRRESRKLKSCKIVNLALEYYYLSSTMTQTRTIFLYLMIAFEALFKAQDENSASAASSRIAKLLANTKSDYNDIHSFMWNLKKRDGCCQIRNCVVHGDFTSIPTAMFWRLRNLLRYAIVNIMNLILSSQIDSQNYYLSLNNHVNDRFRKLSNN